jgi:hypothetical protein
MIYVTIKLIHIFSVFILVIITIFISQIMFVI